MTPLNVIRFSADFKWYSKELNVLGPKACMLFVPNLNWLVFGTPKFSLFWGQSIQECKNGPSEICGRQSPLVHS